MVTEMSAMQFDLKSCARSQNRMSAQHKFDLHDFKRKLSLYCIYFEIPQFNRLDTLFLVIGAGGGGGCEDHYFLTSSLGRAVFLKKFIEGRATIFEIITICHESLNSELS